MEMEFKKYMCAFSELKSLKMDTQSMDLLILLLLGHFFSIFYCLQQYFFGLLYGSKL